MKITQTASSQNTGLLKSIISSCIKISLCLVLLSCFAIARNRVKAEEKPVVVEQKTGFYYTIQKGDTLWDLSQRFSDSPWVWPDLWKENEQIANPHWIYPGNRIRLYRKDAVSRYDTPVEMTPVARNLEPIHYLHKDIDMVGFIRKEPVKPSALIAKVKYEKELISDGDLVFLRKETDQGFFPGSLFTVYRTYDPIKSKETGKYIGVQHYITGIVEIIKDEPEFATAKVIETFRAMYIGDKLMPHVKRSQEIPINYSPKKLNGTIIVSEEGKAILGDHDVAFIDLGKNDGVIPGQFFNIYYQEKADLGPGQRNVTLDTQVFGELMVLHTEDNTSTIIVTQSDDPIPAGSKISSITE